MGWVKLIFEIGLGICQLKDEKNKVETGGGKKKEIKTETWNNGERRFENFTNREIFFSKLKGGEGEWNKQL